MNSGINRSYIEAVRALPQSSLLSDVFGTLLGELEEQMILGELPLVPYIFRDEACESDEYCLALTKINPRTGEQYEPDHFLPAGVDVASFKGGHIEKLEPEFTEQQVAVLLRQERELKTLGVQVQ